MERRYVTASEIRAAKEMDLLTYLQTYEPQELVRDGAGYRTRTHDSLKISHGMWHWFSQGIGGRTALDYLIHVKGMDFVSAVRLLCGGQRDLPRSEEATKPRPFVLPPRYPDCARVVRYLKRRGISGEVLRRCIDEDILYESDRYHNAVFIGKDEAGTPRYAMQRSTGQRPVKLEVEGSDKRFSFSLEGTGVMLMVAESAIDALSLATMMQQAGKPWRNCHYLSLGGVSVRKSGNQLPLALNQYLAAHPQIHRVRLALDDDEAGRGAAQQILAILDRQYDASAVFPEKGKDFNEYLQMKNRRAMQR